ncbi:THAP domain-containing protein 5-like isoform X2 [Mizuhopecten yessoensis]|uniref:THAP domain-containing protein 5-like isoform X2 n=1 Tax=Mizuhopecten yessoensis TaxID=6573 RepID=UPI000B45E1DF|nr:THAP domain-containing protein 5-like isoform X2 [Mizuhopecten yessoensis]
MVRSCVVFKCFNRADACGKEQGISFFRFPVDKKKRLAWIKAVNRDKWTPTNASYICSTHFEGGWHSYDYEDVNYRPTIFHYKEKRSTPTEKAREQRVSKRKLEQEFMEAEKAKKYTEDQHKMFSVFTHSYCEVSSPEHAETAHMEFETTDDSDIISFQDNECQTEPLELIEENKILKEELQRYKEQLLKSRWSTEQIKGNDTSTKFYTGLPTFAVFLWLFRYKLS